MIGSKNTHSTQQTMEASLKYTISGGGGNKSKQILYNPNNSMYFI